MFRFFFLLLTVFALHSTCKEKVFICGICQNIEPIITQTMVNLSALSNRFEDYRIVIYENNSKDKTAHFLKLWPRFNSKVTVFSENLLPSEIPLARTEKIALARNKLLDLVRSFELDDFDHLIMIDLDMGSPWPLDEIVKTVTTPGDWDAVTANGLQSDRYYDRYALRDKNFPLGAELIEFFWHNEFHQTPFSYPDEERWQPIYSAFGGLAIYKTKSILSSSYSGIITEDIEAYYHQIFKDIPYDHPHRIAYFEHYQIPLNDPSPPLLFIPNFRTHQPLDYPFVTCCEHLSLYATMAKKGHGNFFLNPKLKMYY